MDWGAISAIAEVIAAVAVVVSLIYLAVQIKDNTKYLDKTIQATRTQSAGSMLEGFDRWRDMILDQENADIWIRGLDDLESLNRPERLKFNMIAAACIWSCWYMYQINRNEGLMPEVNGAVWQDIFKHQGFRDWMADHRRYHADDFGEFLDRVSEAVGSERFKVGDSSSLTSGRY